MVVRIPITPAIWDIWANLQSEVVTVQYAVKYGRRGRQAYDSSYVKDKGGTVKAAQYTTSCRILSLRVSHCLLLFILQSALSFLSCRVPTRHGHPFAQGSPR